jgi:hypothetical protein
MKDHACHSEHERHDSQKGRSGWIGAVFLARPEVFSAGLSMLQRHGNSIPGTQRNGWLHADFFSRSDLDLKFLMRLHA